MACEDTRQLTEQQRQDAYQQQRTGVQRAIRPFTGSATLPNLIDYINRELMPAVKQARSAVNDVYLQVADNAPSANPLGYYFSTETGAADPTSGRVRLNASPQNTATVLRISQTNGRLVDVAPWLDVMNGSVTSPLGVVTLADAINPGRFLRADLDTMTDQGAYWDLGITITEASHPDPFVDAEAVTLAFIPGVADNGGLGAQIPPSSLTDMSANTLLGNPTAAPAAPVEIPVAALSLVGRSAGNIDDITAGATVDGQALYMRTNAAGTLIDWFTMSEASMPRISDGYFFANMSGTSPGQVLAKNLAAMAGPGLRWDTTNPGDYKYYVQGSTSIIVGVEGGDDDVQRAALAGGDVTAPQNSNVLTIVNDAVTNAKLANMAEGLIKGRALGAGTGDPQDLTGVQVGQILREYTAHTASGAADLTDYVPASPGIEAISHIYIDPAIDMLFNSLTTATTGKKIRIVKLANSNQVTIVDEAAAGTAAMRFKNIGNTTTPNIVLRHDGANVLVEYDGTRWNVIEWSAGIATTANAGLVTPSASLVMNASAIERAAITGFVDIAQNANAATSAEPIVTYSASANMSAERVTTSSTSVTVSTGVANQIEFQRAALTGAITASANSNATLFDTNASGAGLTGGGTAIMAVGAGTGITVNANDVQLSTIAAESFFVNGTAGAAVPTAIAGSTVAGAGLTYTTGGILAVGAGTGITVNANDVAWNGSTTFVPDGDKGDITVSASGTAWTVDTNINKTWTGQHVFNTAADMWLSSSAGGIQINTLTAAHPTGVANGIILFTSQGIIHANATTSFVVTTGGTERLEIEDDGAWQLGGSTGTTGHTIVNAGASAPPAWGQLPTAGIADAAVTLAKQANLAQSTIIGRAESAGTGVPQALTPTQVVSIIDGESPTWTASHRFDSFIQFGTSTGLPGAGDIRKAGNLNIRTSGVFGILGVTGVEIESSTTLDIETLNALTLTSTSGDITIAAGVNVLMTGNAQFGNAWAHPGAASETLNAATHDKALGNTSVWRVVPSADPREVTGIVAVINGQRVLIVNLSTANRVRIMPESGSSTAGNRFSFDGTSLDIEPEQVREFWYDNESDRWRPIGPYTP